MPNKDHTRNVSGLLSHAAAKNEAATQRIDAAIRTLVSKNEAVNFNTVATLAHVSKTTLYNNSVVRARIEHLRGIISPASPTHAKHNVTDKGKDVILAAKNKRINELEAEVERLSGILKRCYANEYDKY